MSAENDVPLGEESRHYYERQFGDRIRKVSKGGGNPRRGGGANSSGCAASAGIGIGIYLAIRFILAIAHNGSSTPLPPQFDTDFQKQLPDLKPLRQADRAGDPLFTDEDVPFPQGLCYRIQQESRQQHPTPGKRIYELATAAQRELIVKAASGQKLSNKEQGDLSATWNALLRNDNFYDGDSFVLVPGIVNLVVAQAMRDDAAANDSLFNRLLLEKCYPQQIIPLRRRAQLDGPAREVFRQSALADLEAARRQYEPAKR